jgi:hypothetical protein
VRVAVLNEPNPTSRDVEREIDQRVESPADRTGASWNPLGMWLKQVDALQN